MESYLLANKQNPSKEVEEICLIETIWLQRTNQTLNQSFSKFNETKEHEFKTDTNNEGSGQIEDMDDNDVENDNYTDSGHNHKTNDSVKAIVNRI